MRRTRLAVLAAALLALPACRYDPAATGPRSAVQLTAGRGSYRAGESVSLGLRNASTETWGYNVCTRIVERETPNGWALVPEPDRVCTMELSLLSPGQALSTTTELPAGLAAGRYRIALSLTREGNTGTAARTVAYAGPFAVGP